MAAPARNPAAGLARRTFTIPENAVRAAVLEAFDRTGVEVQQTEASDGEEHIVGQLRRRAVDVRLTLFSETLTGVTLSVKRRWFLKDRATASELLEQIEQALAENPTFARRLRRPTTDDIAASPR